MTELNDMSVGEATTIDWPDWPIYLGQYTDYTQADSTDPSVYTWSVMRGNDGAQGPQGPTGATGPKGDTGSTGFFIGTTPPPNPAVGTVWATNDASGNMVSAKKWNGSAWVSTAFTQDLVAGNISATKIVGGELDVNKITVKNAQNIPIEGAVSLGEKLSDIKLDADSLNAYVKGSRGSKTLESILSMDPDHSSIAQVVNGQIAAAIGTYSDGTVRIDGKALYINAQTKIDNATIKSAMIDSIEADKIKSGTLDASQIRVTNLDANSITTGSLSAVVNDLRKFKNYTVSASSPWDFNYTKSSYGNWFLIGETTADHVYNGPSYFWDRNQKVTPYMYVTSRGTTDGRKITVTVWKDNDPTQYQRVWDGDSNRWSDWVMLPNSQNLVSAINLSPDSVKISGKNIELDGNTRIADGFTLSADKIRAGTLNGVTITSSTFANAEGSFKVDSNGNINGASINGSSFNSSTGHIDQNNGANSPWMPWKWDNATFNVDSGFISTTANNAFVPGQGITANVIGTYSPAYLKFTLWSTDGKSEYGRSYLDSGGLYVGIGSDATNIGPDSVQASKVYANNELDAGNLILASNTIYNNNQTDIYFTHGGVGTAYSGHAATIHATLINSSTLSAKTDLQKLDEQYAINAIKNIEEYSYQYIGDAERGSKQRYVSGIIDDVNQTPQYKMDPLFIYESGKDRVDSNLLNVQTVVIQNLLKRVEKLESLTSGKQ